jgi:hypothetical protein
MVIEKRELMGPVGDFLEALKGHEVQCYLVEGAGAAYVAGILLSFDDEALLLDIAPGSGDPMQVNYVMKSAVRHITSGPTTSP